MDVSCRDDSQELVEGKFPAQVHIVRMPHRVATFPPRPGLDDRIPVQQASDQPIPVLAHPVLVQAAVRLPVDHDPWSWQVNPGLLILADQRLVKDAGGANVTHIQAELIAEDAGDMPPRRDRSFVEKLDAPAQ